MTLWLTATRSNLLSYGTDRGMETETERQRDTQKRQKETPCLPVSYGTGGLPACLVTEETERLTADQHGEGARQRDKETEREKETERRHTAKGIENNG